MGCAQSSNAAADGGGQDAGAKQRSDEIERQLRKEKSDKRSEVRIPSCGGCHCGRIMRHNELTG